ncbi:hypothetical protein PR048_007169 [Dryococelus australis]|uniref:Uncharacterized protein n=1 Tax=Dryococelus australis TaxID=614101 RepID=A0ABQ9ICV4_9NEOP|nr:hypothetical protein PR048_007169 [Dryococelus australis]
MEQHRNEGAGKTEDPPENPPTNGIVRHDSHMRKSGATRPGGAVVNSDFGGPGFKSRAAILMSSPGLARSTAKRGRSGREILPEVESSRKQQHEHLWLQRGSWSELLRRVTGRKGERAYTVSFSSVLKATAGVADNTKTMARPPRKTAKECESNYRGRPHSGVAVALNDGDREIDCPPASVPGTLKATPAAEVVNVFSAQNEVLETYFMQETYVWITKRERITLESLVEHDASREKRLGIPDRALASQRGGPGSIPGFQHVGIVSDNRRSPVSPRPCIPALLHTHLVSPSCDSITWVARGLEGMTGWQRRAMLYLECANKTRFTHYARDGDSEMARATPDTARLTSETATSAGAREGRLSRRGAGAASFIPSRGRQGSMRARAGAYRPLRDCLSLPPPDNTRPRRDTEHATTQRRNAAAIPLMAIKVNMERRRNEGAGKREIPEKIRRPTASSGTISTCGD